MIPQEKSAAVARGLREAFGVTEFEDIRPITKGQTSSLVFRVVVRGTPFLLKIIMRERDSTLSDHLTCLKAAAEAGLAPHVWYTSGETAFPSPILWNKCLYRWTKPWFAYRPRCGPFIRYRRFPKGRITSTQHTCSCSIRGLRWTRFSRGFRRRTFSPKTKARNFSPGTRSWLRFTRITIRTWSSHNDLFKPDNILFDGQRVWLVDWEAAFLNDRYADLAVAANLIVTTEAEQRLYLQEYFGGPPDPYQSARFFLAQQVAHIFYAMVFLLFGSAGKPIDWNEPVPEFGDFHRRIWAGEVNLADNHTKILYGRVHWERLLRNMQRSQYNEALKIVADRHATN